MEHIIGTSFVHSFIQQMFAELAVILLTCVYHTLTTKTARFMREGAVSQVPWMLCAYLLGEWRVELKACLRHWDAPGKEVGGAGGLHSRLHHTSHRPWSLHRPSFNCEILEDHWRPDSGNRFPSGKTSIHLLCVSETPGEGSESPTLRSTATRKEWRENGRSSAPPVTYRGRKIPAYYV